MKIKYLFLTVLLCLFLGFSPVLLSNNHPDDSRKTQAETQSKSDVEDVEDLSLTDLLDQEVTVVSKKSQKVEEAPAIISVITRKEMMDRGYLNLLDALNSLPGINSVETFFGFRQVFFRGIYSPLYNDKTLVLINGNPFWDSVHGSHYIESFPMEAIKRLEVIRGPGSTLYGTNAFAGVINIVTESGESLKGSANGFLRYGSHKTFEAGLTAGNSKDDVSWLLSLTLRNGEGYPVENPVDELGNSFAYDAKLDYNAFYGEFKYKGFKISTYTFFQDKTKIDALPIHFGSHENTENRFMGTHFMAEYSTMIKDKGQLKIRSSYNYFDKDFHFLFLSNSPAPDLSKLPDPTALFLVAPTKVSAIGQRFDLEANLNYAFSDQFELMVGAGYESWYADQPEFVFQITGETLQKLTETDSTDNDFFAYIQGTVTVNPQLQILAGARYVYNKDFGSFLNPRGGMVWSPSKSLYIKALYGSAFRSPTMNEKYLNFGTAIGNEELNPEKLKTLELGIDYVLKKLNLRLNFYHTAIDDLIGRIPLPGGSGITQYANLAGTSKYTGVEGEIRGVIGKYFRFYLNVYIGKGEDQNGEELQYIPNLIQNGGITFKASGFLASFYYSYMDSVETEYRSFLYTMMNPATPFQSETIDSAFLLNAKIGYTLKKQLTISLIGQNLGDKQVMAPEFVRKFIPSLQNGPGRRIYLELRKSF